MGEGRFHLPIMGACAANPDTGPTVAACSAARVERAERAASRHVLVARTAADNPTPTAA